MTIDEAKKLLPPELKYPLPIEVIDNLINVQAIPLQFDFDEDGNGNKGMHYAMMAALIELKERRECGSNNSNAREDFMHIVYNELSDDADNCRANRIIDAADAYADSFDDMVIPSSIRRSVFEIERMTAKRKAQECEIND